MKPWEKYGGSGPWAKYGGAPDVAAAFAKGEANTLIPDSQPQPTEPSGSAADDLIAGAPEAALSIASSIPANIAGGLAGAFKTITGGKFGTQEGISEGARAASDVAGKFTYLPRGPEGKGALERISKLLDETGLAGINPAELAGASTVRGVGPAAREAGGKIMSRAGDVAMDVVASDNDIGRLTSMEPVMPGVGSAETDVARMRRERAASLPVPLKLSKGQATRDFEQQRFERETSKDAALGKPLRTHYAEQNEQILRNFDAWVDQTGAEAPTLRGTGQAVDKALMDEASAAKRRINAAYTKAREAGEMEAPVSTDSLVAWVEKSRSAARNAPVISAVEDELVRLGGATRGADGKLVPKAMPLNSLEEVRQMVGKLATPGTPNMPFGIEAKKLIDEATEGAGGKLYQEARTLRSNYARKFEDHAVIDNLLRMKPGTRDRAVALEDVFKHAVLDSSLDDLTAFGRTLKAAGPKGQAAWRELQGQTINYIREQSTKGVSPDVRGNPIVSPAQVNKLVKELDRDGKLDYIFGKANAQQVRDLTDIAKDVYTAPPGAVNTSTSGAVVIEALKEMALGKFGAAAKIVKAGRNMMEGRKVRARISDALEQPVSVLSEDERNTPIRELQ